MKKELLIILAVSVLAALMLWITDLAPFFYEINKTLLMKLFDFTGSLF
jgi:hypothetical protein